MVPSGLSGDNVIVLLPFAGGEVVDTEDFVLTLGVPAAIRVELAIADENAVAAATNGRRSIGALLLVLGPGFCVDVEAVDVSVCASVVAKATVSTIDVNLALSVGVAAVSAGRRGADRRLLVGFNIFAACNACPLGFVALGLEPPAVIEASSWGSVASVDEEALRLGVRFGWVDGYMLGSGNWLLANKLLLLPGDLASSYGQLVDLVGGADLLAESLIHDTSVHNIITI